ncbi:fumarylacetoacetate hydrolase family protein [Herbaspirillum huttiense]|uniref:fumarylacetoacetate hydrolase family protein n=1 Tax=Herbaspirillum TaxID=963 RepID=UPI000C0A114F|nr:MULTISPECIES: fumarylacetoacetate hydrolase family protein [unclassified Herbaspirillum]MAF04567.1 fumarylacetoacetate hydrolase [Herbaspirillum sp.]MBO15993.1 fumarylacetoacetate hydrolase [Herbaspirillum sp.]|tara:strand:+ start:82 stop:1065 length:984 start_codon:yes stop_codon:yes gene_type:complete
MKFATLRDGTPDGALVLVARNAATALPVPRIARTLIDALARWDEVTPALAERYQALNEGRADGAIAFDAQLCMAPLPRAPQWLDASAFLNHGRLMEEAFKTPPIPYFDTVPVMYQGASDDLLGPHQDVPLRSEAEGIDFEGEFGVVVGPVAMGATPDEALQAVRLVVQLNDWSLRALGPHEMKTGFGFLQAKPSTAFAPIAVTPDELGDAWRDGRVQMRLQVQWNGARFGEPHGGEMNFSFGQLIAHAAHSRRLTAGCIIGSGTVSNVARAAGSACIAERRVIEKIDHGEIRTGFMHFGDEVRMQAHYEDGRPGPFGIVQQRVVQAA